MSIRDDIKRILFGKHEIDVDLLATW